MDQLKELEDSFIEEYESAMLLQKHSKKKSTTILLAKAMFALADYIIFKKYHQLPKNHAERFRILEIKEQALYRIIDVVWERYTDTYSKPSLEETTKLFQKAIQEICKHGDVSEKIKEVCA